MDNLHTGSISIFASFAKSRIGSARKLINPPKAKMIPQLPPPSLLFSFSVFPQHRVCAPSARGTSEAINTCRPFSLS